MSKRARTVEQENRQFNDSWTEEFLMVPLPAGGMLCLECNTTVKTMKRSNAKSHYEIKHGQTYNQMNPEFRKERVASLISSRQRQQSLMRRPTDDNKKALLVGSKIAYLINKKGKLFMDGQIIKECIEIAADTMCDNEQAKQVFQKISLSRPTITRRTEQLSANIQAQLEDRMKGFLAYSIALDESTDKVGTAQLSIFIRGVDKNLIVTEDLLALRSMTGTTTGKDIYNEIMATIKTKYLALEKLSAIVTDGAPSMNGVRNGFTTLLLNKIREEKISPLPLAFHCIIHQENLAAKILRMDNVLQVVKETVNYIRSRGLKHRQFRQFLDELQAEYEDIPYFAEVRWLSKGKMIGRAYTLQTEILNFCESHGRELPEFRDSEFLNDFAFLVDILTHLNDLNTKLQGKDKLISDLYHHVGGFDGMLELG
ncbi:hypothetical protein EB796_024498 [Bugula neritina]|uniref:SPIN-DOC-like zinc-finger domain-containing protein n=1 Tax=Bugula neritina TaxID=10212 RepID=A0A7J7IVD6_BUGNE|nr:hypothetical protein EB796_024498 [Bugula neritina]